jgi:hypothetical protein
MQTFAKKPLYWAVAAALTGLGSAVPMGEALAQETNVGQALVFPYYTVNNGWVTTFKAINTTDSTLAVKVRFHESKNSRDVLDFNIIMSPYDVWSGWVQEGENGAPEIYTHDNTCTSPQVINGAEASSVAYTGEFDDTGGQGNGRMREGYVEMLVMGSLPYDLLHDKNSDDSPAYPTAYYAEHVDGVPRDCGIVDQNFYPQSDSWETDTSPLDPTYVVDLDCGDGNANYNGGAFTPDAGSGSPQATCDFFAPDVFPLKGNLSWLHSETGTGAGTEAIAVGTGIAGRGTPPSPPAAWSEQNLVTAQLFPWFLEPTFATPPSLWTVTGATTFEMAITFAGTLNEWADNPTNGAAVDWVINFPTKGFHVDKFNEQIQAAVSKYRNFLNPVVYDPADINPLTTFEACNQDRTVCAEVPGGLPMPLEPFEYLFGQQGDGDSTVTVNYNLYDSEEGGVSAGSTTISPAPPGEIESLRWEANVLQFSTEPVLDSPKAIEIGASAELDGAPNGWALVDFKKAKGGLPVVGFAVKERDRGDPATNYGQAMDNGYLAPASTITNGAAIINP